MIKLKKPIKLLFTLVFGIIVSLYGLYCGTYYAWLYGFEDHPHRLQCYYYVNLMVVLFFLGFCITLLSIVGLIRFLLKRKNGSKISL